MREIRIDLSPNRVWFTSDLHFGHANIIRYSRRPFADVEAMDAAIIRNWNACVQPGDAVFHLGDWAMTGDRQRLASWFNQLNGDKYALLGNHDVGLRSDVGLQRECFKAVWDVQQIKVRDVEAHGGWRRVFLHHYAQRVWNKSHHGAFHLYGHSHGTLSEESHYFGMDVGIDATARRISWGWRYFGAQEDREVWERCFVPVAENYRPISYAEACAVMKTRTFGPVDHHGMAD